MKHGRETSSGWLDSGILLTMLVLSAGCVGASVTWLASAVMWLPTLWGRP